MQGDKKEEGQLEENQQKKQQLKQQQSQKQIEQGTSNKQELEKQLKLMGFEDHLINEALLITLEKDKAIQYIVGNLDEKDKGEKKMEGEENDEDFQDVEEQYKMIFLVRMDLKMGLGKIAAQVGHATLKAYKQIEALSDQDELQEVAFFEWLETGQKKVVLKVADEGELSAIVHKAQMQKINNCYIRDAGLTQIEAGSVTVAAIGPATSSDLQKLTDNVNIIEEHIYLSHVIEGFRHSMQTRYREVNSGEGAYSTVFKVERLADKKIYALKKVKLANLSEKEVENALTEVRILASVKNSAIIGYKEVFLEGKSLCIVMEFADDGDLYQKIVEHKKRKQFFQEQQIWNVLIQILIGLKKLHSFNIMHRDLKSANIFLNKSGEAKLGDLNVSKIAKNGLLYTQTGTPYYASPEVWKDEPYDAKSDIWSLGCVIYQMTTLQPPFQAEDMQGLMKAVTLGMYPPINSKFSKQLGHVIKLMLQQKAKTRPSADKLFNSSLIQKKIEELQLQTEGPIESNKSELLKTIRIPRKLHYLTDRLPKPNYENLSDPGAKSIKDSPEMSYVHDIKKGSLPKLGQILKPGLEIGDKRKRKGKGKGSNGGLMIEGRSKIIEDARSQEKGTRNIDKEIKEELKRIYKVRQVGHSYDPRKKKSQRSIVLPPIRL